MIETGRLLLRKPNSEDLDIISNILSCPKQTKYLPNKAPYNSHQQKVYLVNRIDHWTKNDFGTFIVCLKSEPQTKLGFVGAELAPNPEYVDIRFGISDKFEGNGYITEAALELIRWLFSSTPCTKLYGVSMKRNFASKAVLKKIGMKPESNVDLYNCAGLDNFSVTASSAIRCAEY